MTVATATRVRRSGVVTRAARSASEANARRSRLQAICSVALVLGAGVHLNVGLAHAGWTFGTLSLLAAAAQVSLGVAIVLRPAALLPTAVLLLELVLLQFYLLNVTIGLPPAIAHVHSGGEHVVWGYTFALPGVIDLEGVTAVITEVVGTATAVALSRSRAAKEPV